MPLSLSLLVPQQDKNLSKDRHFRASNVRVGPQAQPATATAGLSQANEHIDLFAYALLFLPEGHPRLVELLREKATAGVRIRIALADPAAPETTARSIEEQLGPDGMAARIRNALLHFAPLKGLPGVDVQQYASPMYNSIFRFDEEMLVTPHLYGTPGYRAPLLHLQRAGADGPFDQFAGHIERLWSISTPVWSR